MRKLTALLACLLLVPAFARAESDDDLRLRFQFELELTRMRAAKVRAASEEVAALSRPPIITVEVTTAKKDADFEALPAAPPTFKVVGPRIVFPSGAVEERVEVVTTEDEAKELRKKIVEKSRTSVDVRSIWGGDQQTVRASSSSYSSSGRMGLFRGGLFRGRMGRGGGGG